MLRMRIGILLCAASAVPGCCQPADVVSLVLEGSRLRALGQWTSAERVLTAAFRQASADENLGFAAASSANELGWLYQDQGRLEEAEHYYTAALRFANVLAIANNLAALYLETGQYSHIDRLHLAGRVRGAQPGAEVTRAKVILAGQALHRGQIEIAEPLFLEALAAYGNAGQSIEQAVVLNNLACISKPVEHLERAIALLAGQPETDPVLLQTQANLAIAYAAVKRRAEAANLATKAARTNSAEVLYECAAALKQSGHKSEARRLRKRAASLSARATTRQVIDIADLRPN